MSHNGGAAHNNFSERRVGKSVGASAFDTWRARVVADGKAADTDVFWMLAGNTRSYGGIANITHRAVIDDGLLNKR